MAKWLGVFASGLVGEGFQSKLEHDVLLYWAKTSGAIHAHEWISVTANGSLLEVNSSIMIGVFIWLNKLRIFFPKLCLKNVWFEY